MTGQYVTNMAAGIRDFGWVSGAMLLLFGILFDFVNSILQIYGQSAINEMHRLLVVLFIASLGISGIMNLLWGENDA